MELAACALSQLFPHPGERGRARLDPDGSLRPRDRQTSQAEDLLVAEVPAELLDQVAQFVDLRS
jgi:hypothetical protein